MQLTVTRKTRTPKSIVGELAIDGKFFCYTLEDTDRGLKQTDPLAIIKQKKVQNQTAIPAGTYEVVMNFSNRFQKYMPQLLSVPGFEGVRIHGGNTAENTEGCILIGFNRDSDDRISNCASACVQLFAAIKAVEKTSKAFIKIVWIKAGNILVDAN